MCQFINQIIFINYDTFGILKIFLYSYAFPSNFIYVNVYIHINNYRYSRQINIHEEENEHYTTQCFTEKDIHLTENNNIEGQENFNMSSNPSFMKENASPGNENKDDASNNESVSVKDDFGNITPWTEKL